MKRIRKLQQRAAFLRERRVGFLDGNRPKVGKSK